AAPTITPNLAPHFLGPSFGRLTYLHPDGCRAQRSANLFRSVTVMPESYQQKLKRVRPPRVMIDYKVETEGAEPILELPFVVGVMADLSGMPNEGVKKGIKQRRFVPI